MATRLRGKVRRVIWMSLQQLVRLLVGLGEFALSLKDKDEVRARCRKTRRQAERAPKEALGIRVLSKSTRDLG